LDVTSLAWAAAGSLTIEETSDRQNSASKASDKHGKDTCKGGKGDGS
jgi:hypothetical protein